MKKQAYCRHVFSLLDIYQTLITCQCHEQHKLWAFINIESLDYVQDEKDKKEVKVGDIWNIGYLYMYRVAQKVVHFSTNHIFRTIQDETYFTKMFLEPGNRDQVADFMQLLNILTKLAQCYYTEKWQLSTVLIEVIFLL